ncbi:hypothetical protein PUATCC27989T_00448 [Phytobacter ursingii]|nr:hypothetical protein PUATCC27989T_00448 [Phytobacter ursingii]
MELLASQIKDGDIFYGVKSVGDFPEFCKFNATKSSAKQIKAKKVKMAAFGSTYEHILRATDWRYFSDFNSARSEWVESVLDRDIKNAENRLAAAKERKAKILLADDVE